MDEYQTKTLRENRMKIVNDLEPRGKVLDTLYEDGILTENDIELVSSATTRKERCQLLLSILPTRGPVAYGSFQKALEVGQYEYLADQLGAEVRESRKNTEVKTQDSTTSERTRCTRKCQKCWKIIRTTIPEGTRINSSLAKVFEDNCCLLLDNIEPRDVIDQLFQEHVITTDDIDVIVSKTTRRSRCELLLQILLLTEGNEVVNSFKLSLVKKYSYVVEQITNNSDKKKIKVQEFHANTEVKDIRQSNEKCSGVVKDPCQCISKSDIGMAELKISLLEIDDETAVKGMEKTTDENEIDDKQKRENGMNTVDGSVVIAPAKSQGKRERRKKEKWKERSSRPLRKFNKESPKQNYESENDEVLDKHKRMNSGHSKRIEKGEPALCENLNTQMPVQDNGSHIKDRKEIVPMQMTAIHSQKPSRRLSVAFNYLSTLINQGDFTKFEDISLKLQTSFPTNYDLMCIIGYLQTSRDLFQTNFDAAKSRIDETMTLLPRTSNPRYFMLELYTAKTRMYITRKKLEKLQTTLDEAMMILETDPVGCTGRAAGWLYINDARNKTAQLSCLNLRSPNACQVYERLYDGAKSSFQRSMTNFKRDGGKDGPFGFGYGLCRLVILLLRCGDNGLTMDSLTPSADDIHSAGQYLNHLEDSDIVISKILDMHFRLAKCDYQFRRGKLVRALEHAQIAYDLATEMKLLEFTEHAYNRVSYLKSKSSIVSAKDEISEEDVHKILFEETSCSECDTQNE